MDSNTYANYTSDNRSYDEGTTFNHLTSYDPFHRKISASTHPVLLPKSVQRKQIQKTSQPLKAHRSRTKKRTRTVRDSMPTHTTSRPVEVQMPSFASIYEEEANNGITKFPDSDTLKIDNSLHSPVSTSNSRFPIFHQHRESTSTSASESSDSSPTTTISTVDSSSMTEPSPGPSPESPASKHMATSFIADLRSRNIAPLNGDAAQQVHFELARPMTPAKKPRNLKGLAVNTASTLSLGRPTPSATFPLAQSEKTTSAPASPSFVKPPTPPRRKPAMLGGLSIQTNTKGAPPKLSIPPTPSFGRPGTLRHFQSSPQLPVFSPSVLPEGGMALPAIKTFSPNPHGFAEIPMEDEEDNEEPNFDIPQSREEKPESYPNGPICIYESGVDLFYEPSADIASRYDCILNVASEVKNPFSMTIEEAHGTIRPELGERSYSEPASTVDTVPADFAAAALANAQEMRLEPSHSPTTPKAAPLQPFTLQVPGAIVRPATSNRPEYIHIPWEHNTDIVPDLYKLVKVIEDRVQKRKRVLVHCQCGVSRSASLIVAYGLYKNPGISVQEAYDAVKKRSKWIGPNMNLIMQLQEFRSGLLRAANDKAFHEKCYGTPALRKLSPGLKSSQFQQEVLSAARTPHTAPLPPEGSTDSMYQRASTGNMEAISPGPLTAPSGMFPAGFRRSWGASPTEYDANRPPASASATMSTYPAAITSDNHHAHLDLAVPSNSTRQDSGVSETISNVALPAPRMIAISPPKPLERKVTNRVPNFSRPVLHVDHDMPDAEPPTTLLSPRAEEFHMVGISRQDHADTSYGVLSPDYSMTGTESQQPEPSSVDSFNLMSPGLGGGFPKDPFAHRPSPDAMDLSSPRASEFPRDIQQATFGPSTFGFSSHQGNGFHRPDPVMQSGFNFAQSRDESPSRVIPQHVRPILPPSNASSHAQNGDYTFPNIRTSMDLSDFTPPREDDSKTPTQQHQYPDIRLELPSPDHAHVPVTPPKPSEASPRPFLSTPSKKRSLRTRYSSPNMSQQIKLHKLQTAIESKLPKRQSKLPQSQDDIDALMSPRATEFTKNPFHFDFNSKRASIIQEEAPQQREINDVPVSAFKAIDPRSPAQQGAEPIVRNIFEVL